MRSFREETLAFKAFSEVWHKALGGASDERLVQPGDPPSRLPRGDLHRPWLGIRLIGTYG